LAVKEIFPPAVTQGVGGLMESFVADAGAAARVPGVIDDPQSKMVIVRKRSTS
jgi:hypothetical protein